MRTACGTASISTPRRNSAAARSIANKSTALNTQRRGVQACNMQSTHCNTARGLQHATRSMRHVTCTPDNNIPQQHRQSSRSSRMIFVPAHMHVGLRIHVCECARDCMCARARTRACVFACVRACVRACLRERRRHSDFGDRVSARARSTFACCCAAVVLWCGRGGYLARRRRLVRSRTRPCHRKSTPHPQHRRSPTIASTPEYAAAEYRSCGLTL